MRKSLFFLLTLSLLAFIPLIALTQADDEDVTCDDYVADLELGLSNLNVRLSSFVKTASSLSSGYNAYQERRIEWQEIDPPDCAVEFHDDVIAMYANLGDIYAWGLWLEHDPESNSGNRLVQEAIERAGSSIQSVADMSGEISGNTIGMDDVMDSLDLIADRFANG